MIIEIGDNLALVLGLFLMVILIVKGIAIIQEFQVLNSQLIKSGIKETK
jgi:hypothetical protein